MPSSATGTAAIRAAEARRDDPLFVDPWAADLSGTDGGNWLDDRAQSPALQVIAIRSRYFDDVLTRAVTEDLVTQVVLLAAGYDTKAFRLPFPPTSRVFELDDADTLRRKEDVLRAAGAEPACERRAVPADLCGAWAEALVGAGFDASVPSCWVLEGILFYLPQETVTAVLDRVSDLAATGSLLGFDIVNGTTLTHPLTRPWIEMQARLGAPWLGTMDDPAAELGPRGWDVTVVQVGEEPANHGRWPYPVPPRDLQGVPRNWFVTARRE